MNILDNAILAKGLNQGTITEICKVSDIIGKTGKVEVLPQNIARLDKAVQIYLTTEKGELVHYIASEQVGADIRAKKLKLSDVPHLPLIQYTTYGPGDVKGTPIDQRTGEVIAMITYPQGSGQLYGIEAKDSSKAFVRESVFNPADLIAL